jgi:hypothetical protein
MAAKAKEDKQFFEREQMRLKDEISKLREQEK